MDASIRQLVTSMQTVWIPQAHSYASAWTATLATVTTVSRKKKLVSVNRNLFASVETVMEGSVVVQGVILTNPKDVSVSFHVYLSFVACIVPYILIVT